MPYVYHFRVPDKNEELADFLQELANKKQRNRFINEALNFYFEKWKEYKSEKNSR